MTDKQNDLVLKNTWGIPWFVFNISREKNIPGHINIKSDKQWTQFFDS